MRVIGLSFLLMIAVKAYSQVELFMPDYGINIETGVYKSKSYSFVVKKDTATIAPQLTIDSIGKATGYVSASKGLWLFNNSYPSKKEDVAGLLRENSLFTILEIEYRQIYKDTRLMLPISFEVWYRILLNGKIYYMDTKPYRLAFQKDFEPKSQVFTIFNIDKGYDYQYTGGYPCCFNVLVFDKKQAGLKLIYGNYLNFRNWEEFWAPDHGLQTTITNKGLEFELSTDPDNYKAVWNGKDLIDITVKKVNK